MSITKLPYDPESDMFVAAFRIIPDKCQRCNNEKPVAQVDLKDLIEEKQIFVCMECEKYYLKCKRNKGD